MKYLLPLLSVSALCLCAQAEEKLQPVDLQEFVMVQEIHPMSWESWAKWVEQVMPVGDGEGHGPDVGGDEWAMALGKKLEIDDSEDGPEFKSTDWQEAVESKLMPEPAEDANRKLLSSHQVIARLIGIENKKCMGRTTRCPNGCGHSGRVVSFKIQQYESFEKPGEFGDDKQDIFQILIEDNNGNRKVPDAVYRSLQTLKANQVVRLRWNHDYVTQNGSKFPERPLIGVVPVQVIVSCKGFEVKKP